MTEFRETFRRYQLRLVNLSQRNRALRHLRLAPRQDMDWKALDFAEGTSAAELLQRLLAGRVTPVLRSLGRADANRQAVNEQLTRLHRELAFREAENGTYDLCLGTAYVEGKFADGTLVRCPLLLFPVRLEQRDTAPRWQVRPREEAINPLNYTFLRAYEKFNAHRLAAELFEPEGPLARVDSLPVLYQSIHQLLQTHELAIHLPSGVYERPLRRFRELTTAYAKSLPAGELRLVPHAVLGIFPLSDAALWDDYRALLADPSAHRPQRLLSPQPAEPPPPAKRPAAVMPMDGPQEEALQRLQVGQSLTLHGPPGTGKSQWLVNAVTNALAEGKRVLVVSQKRAALEVVHKRLHGLGLGRFAQLVYDHRRDRPRLYRDLACLIEDIPRFADETRAHDATQWAATHAQLVAKQAEEIDALAELDALMQTPQPCGLTPWQLYARCRVTEAPLPVAAWADALDEAALVRFIDLAEQALADSELLAADYPLRQRPDFSTYAREDIRSLQALLEQMQPDYEEFCRIQADYITPQGEELHAEAFQADLRRVRRLQRAVGNAPSLQQLLEQAWAEQVTPEQCEAAAVEAETILAEGEKLTFFQPADAPAAEAELGPALATYDHRRREWTRLLKADWRRARQVLADWLGRSGHASVPEMIEELRAEWQAFRKLTERVENLAGAPLWEQALDAWQQGGLRRLIGERRELAHLLGDLRSFQTFDGERPALSKGPMTQLLDSLVAFYESAEHARRQAEAIRRRWHTALPAPLGERLLQAAWEGRESPIPAWLASLASDADRLQRLDARLATLTTSQRELWEALAPQLVQRTDWAEALRQSFLLAWLERAELAHPILRQAEGHAMTRRLRLLHTREERLRASELEHLRTELRRRLVEAQQLNRRGNDTTFRELRHQLTKKRLIWPLRRLVAEFYDGPLALLMPCLLCSPETAAAILPLAPERVDLVLFDEASQCPAERGLPVALRGKQVAVAGDQHQLPPLDLFATRVDEPEAEELDPASDIAQSAESLLHLAMANLPNQYLLNHYRSEDPRLIAFSNAHFYAHRLNPLPQALPEPRYQPPLRFRNLGGTMRWTGNQEEAQAILADIESALQTEPVPTIAVVCFSQRQQDCLDEALDEHLHKLRAQGEMALLERWEALRERSVQGEPAGLFIKNIEQVQGDERELIFFSIGYSPGSDGRVHARFGLLNWPGGENRLNVAVSRAQKQLRVVCSFEPEQLQTDQMLHAGPAMLKDFLREARAVSEGRDPSSVGAGVPDAVSLPPHPQASWLADALHSRGWQVRADVGRGTFGIDLAAEPPGGGPPLAVLIEGPRMWAAATTRERHVVRAAALRARGWRVIQLWARELWLDPEAALQRVLRAGE